MTRQIMQQFLDRLPADAPEGHRELIESAFGISANFAPKAAAIREDKRFTAEGRNDAVRKELAGPIDHMKQLKARVDGGLAQNNARRAALAPKAPDRSDVVGHLERAELRAWLRTQDVPSQMRHIANEPAVRAAVLSAPAVLSGLREEEYRHALTIEMEATHGLALKALAEEENVLNELKSAVEIAAMRLEEEAGVSLPEIRSTPR